MTGQSRKTDLLVIGLFAVATAVFFSDVLFAGSNFYYRDLFVYHFPMKSVVREAMLSGEFPFWNRFYSGGQPLAANPAYELFYPGQWLILVGSYPFGFALHIVAHVYAALAGMYLLLREIRLGVPAAVLGALSFGMGGLILGSMTTLPTFFVWALAPLVGWGVLRLLRQPDARRFGVAALLAGCQLLVGEPIAILQVWILIAAGSLLFACWSDAKLWRVIVLTALVACAAAAIASVQLLPAIDHAASSIRSRGIPFKTVREYAMPPARPLELFVPHLFGRFDPLVKSFWGSRSFDRGAPYLQSIYCGVGVAILLLAGWMIRARGTWVTLILAAAAFALAIGDRWPLLRMLYEFHLARAIRYPEKFIAFGIVPLIVFAAAVADRLLGGDEKTRRAAVVAGGVVTLLAAIPLAWSMTPRFTESFLAFWDVPVRRADMAAVAHQAWLTGFALSAVSVIWLLVFPRIERRVWTVAALIIVVTDLFTIGNDLVPRMPRPFFSPPPITSRLDPHLADYAIFQRSEWEPYGDDFQRYSAVSGSWFARNALRPFTPAAWHLRSNLELDYDETDLLPTHDLLDAMMKLGNSGFPQWGEAFAAMANIRYIVDLRPFERVLRESNADLAAANPVRFTTMPAPARYYFPDTVVRVRSTDEILESMRRRIPISTAFVPFDAPPPARARARVIDVSESANRARVDVEAAAPALLVATVTRHKYWRATIDGRPAEILPANIAYQAVRIPAGRHQVEFRYSNPLVIAGAVISTLAIAACAVAIALTRPRRRPRTGS